MSFERCSKGPLGDVFFPNLNFNLWTVMEHDTDKGWRWKISFHAIGPDSIGEKFGEWKPSKRDATYELIARFIPVANELFLEVEP